MKLGMAKCHGTAPAHKLLSDKTDVSKSLYGVDRHLIIGCPEEQSEHARPAGKLTL